MLHLTHSPVSIILYNCESYEMKNFGVGVYKNSTECSDTEFTHTAVVVGYGTNQNGD